MIRYFDIVLSLLGLIIFLPIFVLIYLLVCIESKGGGFYSQFRVGRYGVDFKLYKFRSMKLNSDKEGLITIGGKDPRITSVGFFIRKYKLDELPQLFNVLIGDMSIVGPRPEVRKYVDLYSSEQKKILSIRPGITDYASIEYVDENRILGESLDPDKTYVELVMPDKIKYNMKYINNHSIIEYMKIILITLFHVIKG